MAAFSHYQYHLPFLLDSSPFVLSPFPEHPLINTTPPQLPPTHQISSNFPNHQTLSTDNQTSNMTTLPDYNEPNSVPKSHTPETSMAEDHKLENGERVAHQNEKKKKKRGNYRNGGSSKVEQSKFGVSFVGTEGRNKKQNKSNNGVVVKEEEKPEAQGKQDKKKIPLEPPTGYIHVRARRGQATDSHSLAERVRREKISERMRMLQQLVPGCDKVTGKALVLDEIINYVQSLQNQVEFLSMKLASVNPMLCDFTMGQDTLMGTPDRLNSVASPLPSVSQCTNQAPNFVDDFRLDNSASVFLPGQRSNVFSSQDAVSELWDAENQRQMFPDPCCFRTNLCSFQC